MNKNYELALVLKSSLSEENQNKIVKETKELLEKEGKITSEQALGRKNLAYRISGEQNGVFFVINFSAPASALSSIQNILRIEEDILRYMIQELENA